MQAAALLLQSHCMPGALSIFGEGSNHSNLHHRLTPEQSLRSQDQPGAVARGSQVVLLARR